MGRGPSEIGVLDSPSSRISLPPPDSGAAAATAERLRLFMTFSDFNANFLTEGPGLSSPASRRCKAQPSASRSPRRSGVLTHPTPPHPRAGKDVQLFCLMLGWKVTARKPEEFAAVRCPAPVSLARRSRPAGLHPERGDPSAPARSLGRRAWGLAGTWRAGLGRSSAHPSRKDDGTRPRGGAAAGGKGARFSFSSSGYEAGAPSNSSKAPGRIRRTPVPERGFGAAGPLRRGEAGTRRARAGAPSPAPGGASPGGSVRRGDGGAGGAHLE